MKVLRIGSTKGETFTLLKNIDDVRTYIDNYFSQLRVSKGFGDLSHLSMEAQSALLKFIEEKVGDIVCYASRDNISPVLMSRFDRIEKYDDIKIGTEPFNVFVQSQADKDTYDSSLERDFVSKSAENLGSFLVYRKLNRAVLSRVGLMI